MQSELGKWIVGFSKLLRFFSSFMECIGQSRDTRTTKGAQTDSEAYACPYACQKCQLFSFSLLTKRSHAIRPQIIPGRRPPEMGTFAQRIPNHRFFDH